MSKMVSKIKEKGEVILMTDLDLPKIPTTIIYRR